MSLKSENIPELLKYGKMYLKEKGVGEYVLDAELFMMNATGLDRIQLITKDDFVLSKAQIAEYNKCLVQRGSLVPTAYILGHCEFMALDFLVNQNVLIPRADTETLVLAVLECINSQEQFNIIDVGTGSGCIAVSLAHYSQAQITAVDISCGAIETAQKNAKLNGVSHKIEFYESDLFSKLPKEKMNTFDIIVSNPPYIPKDVVLTLMSDVKDNEPYGALEGGIDGLDFYRKITEQSMDILSDKGYIFYEIGYDQGDSVSQILMENGFCDIKVIKDLAGFDRVVTGKKM